MSVTSINQTSLRVSALICKNPGVEVVVTLSSLYDRNVPKDETCRMQWEIYREVHAHNSAGQGNVVTQLVEMDLLTDAMQCSQADAALRLPSKIEEAVKDKITFKK